jgi:hypothetical protein
MGPRFPMTAGATVLLTALLAGVPAFAQGYPPGIAEVDCSAAEVDAGSDVTCTVTGEGCDTVTGATATVGGDEIDGEVTGNDVTFTTPDDVAGPLDATFVCESGGEATEVLFESVVTVSAGSSEDPTGDATVDPIEAGDDADGGGLVTIAIVLILLIAAAVAVAAYLARRRRQGSASP